MLVLRAVAGSSLLTLIDDIASLLDDVATLSKVATKKTAGVLGDDLALNAEQVTGVTADRELPVVWAVAKGSSVNKLILVPAALLISAFADWAITPLLMLGGAFLCFEGFEKVAHKLFHRGGTEGQKNEHVERVKAVADPEVDMVAFEKEKVKGAVRTDFILSAEIIVISLGTVAAAPLVQRILTLSVIAVIMTIGVYGLVAAIVKLDDLGLALSKKESDAARGLGKAILKGAPYLMKGLGIAGTIAMFLVGGGILAHGIPPVHHFTEHLATQAGALGGLVEPLVNGLTGVVAGAILVGIFTLVQRLRGKPAH